MQELLATLESFLEAGVDEVIQDAPRNLLVERQEKLVANQVKQNPTVAAQVTQAQPQAFAAPKVANINKNNLVSELKPTATAIAESKKLAEQATNLDELKDALAKFEGCDLYKTAKNLVFSDGNRESDIVLIGEAPGASEDEQGIPFCGISGKLLDDIFTAIGRKRANNLYITNSVFWRPPGNRRPTDEEIAICRPFVEKHIALKKPKLIVLVGGTALASVLPDVTTTISKIRGSFMKYKNPYLDQEIDIIAIFHPSYLLRQPGKKRVMWDDMVKIKAYLG